jgi:hypothetical protein
VAARKKSTKKAAKSATDNIRLKLVTISNTFNVSVNTVTPPPPGTIVFQDDFESGTISGTKWNIDTDGTPAQQPTNVLYQGSRRCRFEVRRSAGTQYRCELRAKIPGHDDSTTLIGKEIWWGVRLRLFGPYPSNSIGNTIVQLHKSNNGTATANNPMIVLQAINGNWTLIRRWSTTGAEEPGTTQTVVISSYAADVDQDVDFVMYVRADYRTNGVGQIRLWKNGTLMQTLNGPNIYNDTRFGYWKTGLYIPGYQGGTSAGKPDRILHADQYRFALSDGSYDLVKPR